MKSRFTLVAVLGYCLVASSLVALSGIPGTVRVEALNLRASPWGTILTSLPKGHPLGIAEARWAQHPAELHTAIWYRVECDQDGTMQSGWVHATYVQVQGTPPAATPLPTPPRPVPLPGVPPLAFAVADPENALADNVPTGVPTTPTTPPVTTPPTPPAGTPTLADLTAKPADYPGTGPGDPIVAWEWHFAKDDTGRPRTCTWYSHFNDYTLMNQMYPSPPWKLNNSNPVRRSGARE